MHTSAQPAAVAPPLPSPVHSSRPAALEASARPPAPPPPPRGVRAHPWACGKGPRDPALRKNRSCQFLALFGLWRPFLGSGTVKKRLGTKSRSWGSCPDLRGPTHRTNWSAGCLGRGGQLTSRLGPRASGMEAGGLSALGGPPRRHGRARLEKRFSAARRGGQIEFRSSSLEDPGPRPPGLRGPSSSPRLDAARKTGQFGSRTGSRGPF